MTNNDITYLAGQDLDIFASHRYHANAYKQIEALQRAIEASQLVSDDDPESVEESLRKINTVLLGEQGRWLSSGAVAVQLGPLLPLLKQAILLCYAKVPGDPTTLTGGKQKMAQRVYKILDSTDMLFKMQVAAVMMHHIFQPLFDAIGKQQHTLFGGKEGVRKVVNEVTDKLDDMVVETQKGSSKRKAERVPGPAYFERIQACIRLMSTSASDENKNIREFNR